MYYKKIFCEDDVIDVGPYAELGFTAKQLLSLSFMCDQLDKKMRYTKQQNQIISDRYETISDQAQQLADRDQT